MMPDFLLLMHADQISQSDDAMWERYFGMLHASGGFAGGSAVGDGVCLRKAGNPAPLSAQITGYIKISANTLDAAKALIAGNPVYECGGTVELRELPTD